MPETTHLYHAAVAGALPLDGILIPAKRLLYRGLFRGDYLRYLAFRARVAAGACRLGIYERETIRAVKGLVAPGDVTVDVGANFGVYAMTLAGLVGPSGQVHAFEPQTAVFDLLRERLSGTPQVTVVRSAVAAVPGVGRIVVPDIAGDVPEPSLGSLRRDATAGSRGDEVPVTTLDAYCGAFDRLAFVKVDAEGGDLDVLVGGRKTLERLRPVVQVECNDERLLSEFAAFADEIGYDLDVRAYSRVNRMLIPRR